MARSSARPGAGEVVHYEAPRRQREKQRASVVMQPPLTPMIDVVFQLLLFFLLACRFVANEGQIPAHLPDIEGPQAAADFVHDPIRITLSEYGDDGRGVQYRLEGKSYQWTSAAELRAFLEGMARRGDPDKVPVFIRPQGRVRWQHVVDAFNQAVVARFRKIALEASEG